MIRAIKEPQHEGNRDIFEALNDAYVATSHTDAEYIAFLSQFEQKAVITKKEKLLLFVLSVVARDVGPFELRKVRDLLMERKESSEYLEQSQRLALDSSIMSFVAGILLKCNK